MPKELIDNLDLAINSYRTEVGTEPYQPLSTLLNTLQNLCIKYQKQADSGLVT